MKKKIAIILALALVVFLILVYLIPAPAKVTAFEFLNANPAAVNRNLAQENEWKKWWPAENKNPQTTSTYQLNGFTYSIENKQFGSIGIFIDEGAFKAHSVINTFAYTADSVMISWTVILPQTGINPFNKISNYVKAVKLKKSMQQVLLRYKTFAGNQENLYGLHVEMSKVKDTLLMVIKNVQKEPATANEISNNINELKNYIGKHGGKETNYPMLHTGYLADVNQYELMVAIPVNKELPANDMIVVKRMVPGNILTTEVTGGEATIKKALIQLEQYVNDRQMLSPAQPFQLLVTDRMLQPDTTKWITRLYYPVL